MDEIKNIIVAAIFLDDDILIRSPLGDRTTDKSSWDASLS